MKIPAQLSVVNIVIQIQLDAVMDCFFRMLNTVKLGYSELHKTTNIL